MATTVGLTFPAEQRPKAEATKAELAAKAAELGIVAPKGATKAELARLISEAE